MLISMLILIGAIALYCVTHSANDENIKIIGGLLGGIGVLIGLAVAPWMLKVVVVVGVVALPNCTQNKSKPAVICPPTCMARGRCHTPEPRCLGWMRSSLRHTVDRPSKSVSK